MTLSLLPVVEYGHLEPTPVYFDDIDAMGVVHNARYALLVERAMTTFWSRHGHTFDGGPTTTDMFNVVREFSITFHRPISGTGEILVHLFAERVGESSCVYGFRLLSADGATVFADGKRVVIKVDIATRLPIPWTAAGRVIAESLLRPAA